MYVFKLHFEIYWAVGILPARNPKIIIKYLWIAIRLFLPVYTFPSWRITVLVNLHYLMDLFFPRGSSQKRIIISVNHRDHPRRRAEMGSNWISARRRGPYRPNDLVEACVVDTRCLSVSFRLRSTVRFDLGFKGARGNCCLRISKLRKTQVTLSVVWIHLNRCIPG